MNENNEEQYTLGYGPAAVALMALRTAASHAGFFLAELESGMRVLDVGCGPGTITMGLAERVDPGAVVGVELSLQQTEPVAGRARAAGLDLTFERADVYSLPYPDESFDAAFLSAVIGNLQRPVAALDELYRVLKVGAPIGIREFDHSANIGYPLLEFEQRVAELHDRLRIHNGHDPDSGRKVPGLLHAAGFQDIRALATFENHPPRPEAQGNPIMASLLRKQLGPRFLEQGWATQEEIDSWIAGYASYRRGPDYFSAQAWIEVIGYRPALPDQSRPSGG